MSLRSTLIVITDGFLFPQVLFAWQMYIPLLSSLMLVKFNHLDKVTSTTVLKSTFDQVMVGSGKPDALQYKATS